MARITYSPTTIGGKMVAEGVDYIRKGQEKLERAVALMNSLTGGGVTTSALEASAEFGVASTFGDEFYTAVNTMKVNSLVITSESIGDIDMGD